MNYVNFVEQIKILKQTAKSLQHYPVKRRQIHIWGWGCMGKAIVLILSLFHIHFIEECQRNASIYMHLKKNIISKRKIKKFYEKYI